MIDPITPIDAPSPGEVYDTPRRLYEPCIHDEMVTRPCHRRVFLGILDGTPCCQVCPVDVAMSCEVVGGGTTAAGTFPHLYIPCQRDRRRSAVGAISYVASRCARTKGHHTAAWQSGYHDALDDVIGSWRRTAERIHTNSFKWDVSHRVSAETAEGKIRNLDVPTMRDRLVGRCLYVAMRDNMECMLPRTVVGCRSGGGPQSGGNALARCVQNGLTWAARTDVRDIREEGISASKSLASRPGGQELLNILASKKACHVIALKLDRLFRDAADCLNQTRSWDKTGVALHLVDMGGTTINTASPMGRMFMTMTAAFAELERNLIAERTKTALQHLKSQGKKLGGVRAGSTLEEESTVRRIMELHAAKLPLRAIADTLTAEGFATHRGGKWQAETVRKILARAESPSGPAELRHVHEVQAAFSGE